MPIDVSCNSSSMNDFNMYVVRKTLGGIKYLLLYRKKGKGVLLCEYHLWYHARLAVTDGTEIDQISFSGCVSDAITKKYIKVYLGLQIKQPGDIPDLIFNVILAAGNRPISVSFLICTPGNVNITVKLARIAWNCHHSNSQMMRCEVKVAPQHKV